MTLGAIIFSIELDLPWMRSILDTSRSNKDGEWSNWSEWGPCSKVCGNSTTMRTRTCDNPPPMGGGKMCEGGKVSHHDCTDPCRHGKMKKCKAIILFG